MRQVLPLRVDFSLSRDSKAAIELCNLSSGQQPIADDSFEGVAD